MWKVGDRVLAQRQAAIYWYPGTVRHIDGQRYYIIFDDGEDGFASAEELTQCRFENGDQVQVYQPASGDYLPARVTQPGEETLRVRYLNAEEQWVPFGKVRVHPETWKQAEPESPSAAVYNWQVCDRVLACWYDLDWYPGIVLRIAPGRLQILFDSGNQAAVPPEKVRPLQLAPGDRVLCRWKGERDFYTGTLARIEGEKIQVRYDDGDEETTTVRLLRLRRDEWFGVNTLIRPVVGGRVLAQWHDLYWYPAFILAINGKRLHLAYDKGDQGVVAPDQIRPLGMMEGSRVACRRKGSGKYYPGEVMEQEGDKILVFYDDGEREWTSVRMMRVEK